MRFEIKTVTILMCAALALVLGSCTKETITPAEDPQPAEVGFTAASQAVWVKGETDPKTTFPYTNFGVWGIARHQHVASPYILWASNQLTEVSAPEGTLTNQETSNVVFTPVTAAYWLRDYTYDFLAVAPYDAVGLSDVDFTLEGADDNTSGKDYMSFTYDMSNKYRAGNYTFDLLGAADERTVNTGGYSAPQGLTFWHLFSQIEIENIGFASGIDGTVTKILFKAFPSGEYEISYDNSGDNKTSTTGVGCKVITKKSDNSVADKSEIIFTNPNFNSSTSRPIINIIPQKVEYFELYIDFTINEGTSSATYQGFKLDITHQQLSEYVYNGKYNWEITIGKKNAVSFNVVQINDWKSGTTPDDIPLQ
jgi:hypothetical protein